MSFKKKITQYFVNQTLDNINNDPDIKDSLEKIKKLDRELEEETSMKNYKEVDRDEAYLAVIWEQAIDPENNRLERVNNENEPYCIYEGYYNKNKFGIIPRLDLELGEHNRDIDIKIMEFLMKNKKSKHTVSDIWMKLTNNKSLQNYPYLEYLCKDRLTDHLRALWREDHIGKTGNERYYFED